jgi:proteic killer suppression protein
MIKSFRHKGLKKLFENGDKRGVPAQIAGRLRRQMDFLNAAAQVGDMNLPGWDLHQLKGDRKGTWAVKATGNWRITLKFDDGYATDLDLEDYH